MVYSSNHPECTLYAAMRSPRSQPLSGMLFAMEGKVEGTVHKNIHVFANACDLYGIVQTFIAKGDSV